MKRIFILWMIAVGFAACSTTKETQLVILSTNDMHAHIDDYAKVAAFVSQEQKAHPGRVVVLSGGDLFSGNPVVDHCDRPGKGYPIIDLMNRVGYRASAVGNHEFDYGQRVLSERIRQARFPFLCANMHVGEGAEIRQPEPSTVIRVGRLRIGIISGIQVETISGRLIPSSHPGRLTGLTFTEPVEELTKLRDMRNRCDVFLALNHMGVEEDKKLAERMPELDLIVGGHSHTRLDTGVVVNGVLITQAGEYLQYVGRTELTLRGRKVVARRNRLIPVASMTAEDAEVKAAIKKFYDESPLNEVIGRVTARIEGKEGLGNLVTDAEAAMNGADFAFQNAGGIRIGALEPGDMTAKMVYEMDPFGNEVNVVELTPEEMRDLIRVSHRYNKRRHAVDLLVSGMIYTLYTKNGEPDRIEMSFPDGRPLEEGRYYRVALNDYIVSAYKFPHARAAKPTGKSSEETIIAYIRSRKEIAPQAPRTKLIEE